MHEKLRNPILVSVLAFVACTDDETSAGDSTSTGTEPGDSSTAADPTSASTPTTTSMADSSTSESSATDSTDGSTTDGSTSGTSTSDPSSGSSDDTTTGGATGLDDADIMRIHDAVEDGLGQGYATGYSIAIWRDGEVIYAEGFGTKNEDDDAVTTDTVFQIGSDTKKLAAIAVLQQVDAGTLTLDQSIGDLLGGLDLVQSPSHLGQVTVEDVLSHRSGLYDYTPWAEAPDDAVLADVIAGGFAQNEYAMMPPGIAFNYCNPNFALAGRVAEVLAERPWADVIIEDIAMPLGMTQTWARRDDMLASTDDIASGVGPIYPEGIDTYDLWELFTITSLPPDWVTPEQQDDHGFTRPAGLVWSTASDMAVLGGFVIDGDPAVLSAASHDVFRTPVAPFYPGLAPTDLGYGNGLMSQRGFFADDDFYDVTLVSHGGNTLTMTSASAMLPDQRVAVAILANGYAEDTSALLGVLLEVAAADALPAPSDPFPLLGPPRDDLSGYAGSFTTHALGEVTLSFDGANVLVDIPSLAMAGYDVDPVLVPAAQDVFLLDLEGSLLDISFYDDTLAFEFGVNRNFVMQRTDEMMAMPLPDPALVHAWVARVTEPQPWSLASK